MALYPIGGSGVANSPVRVTASTAYDAFGGWHTYTADGGGNTPAAYEPAGFGGQFGYYHDLTGRYLLGHRFYDSFTGRFLTRDPIGYKGIALTFDAENRLTSFGGSTLTNGYRGDSLRAWKQNSVETAWSSSHLRASPALSRALYQSATPA